VKHVRIEAIETWRSLIGIGVYTMKKIYSEVKSKPCVNDWKWIEALLLAIAIIGILVYLGIQFFTGYGSNNITQAVLLTIIAASIQLVFCRFFNWRIIKSLPVILALLLALWGTWLNFTSESWRNAEFDALLCGYITPFIGCMIGWLLAKTLIKR